MKKIFWLANAIEFHLSSYSLEFLKQLSGQDKKEFPDIKLIVAAIDSHLNERGYIVPGMGDAGDRIFNTIY